MKNIKDVKKHDKIPENQDDSSLAKYADARFFKKKDEEAIRFLKKHPVPQEFFKL